MTLFFLSRFDHIDMLIFQLHPAPQPLKTDHKGRVNFGVFTLSAKRSELAQKFCLIIGASLQGIPRVSVIVCIVSAQHTCEGRIA